MPRRPARARTPATFRTDGNIAIHVPDLDRALSFYGGVLGFPVIERTPDLVVFETGSFRLFVKKGGRRARGFIPALEVPDCGRARLYLKEAGCRIVHDWPGGKAAYFQDPFGLVLDITERNPAETPSAARRAPAAGDPARRGRGRRRPGAG